MESIFGLKFDGISYSFTNVYMFSGALSRWQLIMLDVIYPGKPIAGNWPGFQLILPMELMLGTMESNKQ
jgi:hypothetical protein